SHAERDRGEVEHVPLHVLAPAVAAWPVGFGRGRFLVGDRGRGGEPVWRRPRDAKPLRRERARVLHVAVPPIAELGRLEPRIELSVRWEVRWRLQVRGAGRDEIGPGANRAEPGTAADADRHELVS